MRSRQVDLVDSRSDIQAWAEVCPEGDLHSGTIDLRTLPDAVRSVFQEFEEIVNNQMFSFLDEIQAKIDRLCLRVFFDDGSEALIRDLQIFPSTGDLTFRLAELPKKAKSESQPARVEQPLMIGTSAQI